MSESTVYKSVYWKTMGSAFSEMLSGGRFVDVTLVCEGHRIQCHRIVLAACSHFFEDLLKDLPPGQYPVIILPRDVKYWMIQALLEFMYQGEVNVAEDGIDELAKCAEILKIRFISGSLPSSEVKTEVINLIDEDLPDYQSGSSDSFNRKILEDTVISVDPQSKKRKMDQDLRDHEGNQLKTSTSFIPPVPSKSKDDAKEGCKMRRKSAMEWKEIRDREDQTVDSADSDLEKSWPSFSNLEEKSLDNFVLIEPKQRKPRKSTDQDMKNALMKIQEGMSVHTAGLIISIMSDQWTKHVQNLGSAFLRLFSTQTFVDVTLACEGRQIHCHRVVLAACSSYFEKLLEENPAQHPIIILPGDVKFWTINALVEFMYSGEISSNDSGINELVKCAELLQIHTFHKDEFQRGSNPESVPGTENYFPEELVDEIKTEIPDYPLNEEMKEVPEEKPECSFEIQDSRPPPGDTRSRRGRAFDENTILAAISCIQGGVSIYRAAKMYNIPNRTLRDHMKRRGIKSTFPVPSGINKWNRMNRQNPPSSSSTSNPSNLEAFDLPDDSPEGIPPDFRLPGSRPRRFDANTMWSALMSVKDGMSSQKASKVYGIPKQTLCEYMKRHGIISTYSSKTVKPS
ncbi:hypothetical protein DMENIID0001_135830 [Sergentomyia squamirostris]